MRILRRIWRLLCWIWGRLPGSPGFRPLAWLKRSALRWLLIGSLIGSPVWAVQADPWTRADTWREIGWHTVNLIDWGQTLDITRQCQDRSGHYYKESNPFLKDCPSRGDVNHYFFLSAVIHNVIAYSLPVKYRSVFQYTTIGLSGAWVLHNYTIGLKIKF